MCQKNALNVSFSCREMKGKRQRITSLGGFNRKTHSNQISLVCHLSIDFFFASKEAGRIYQGRFQILPPSSPHTQLKRKIQSEKATTFNLFIKKINPSSFFVWSGRSSVSSVGWQPNPIPPSQSLWLKTSYWST